MNKKIIVVYLTAIAIGSFVLNLAIANIFLSRKSPSSNNSQQPNQQKVKAIDTTGENSSSVPKDTCGEPYDSSASAWYPVFLDNANVNIVRNTLCRDAKDVVRKDTGIQSVQVASFTSYGRAWDYAKLINGSVGQPTIVAKSSPARETASLDTSCNSESLNFYMTSVKAGEKTQFVADTNLPDGTQVMFKLSGNGNIGQSKVMVKNGQITSEGFTSKGQPLKGVYTLELLSHFNKVWQLEELLPTLEKYSSPCIREEEWLGGTNKVFRVEVNLEIGDLKAAQQALQEEQAEAVSIFHEAQTLVAMSEQNLKALQRNPDAPVCLKDMQKRIAQVKSLQDRANKLSQKWSSLRIAVISLSNCATCHIDTIEAYCPQAAKYLNLVEEDIKKVEHSS
jgi:hypothetical protein